MKDKLLDYINGKISKKELIDSVGQSKTTVNRYLNSLGYSSNNYFFCLKGALSKHDKTIWKRYYEEYIKGNETILSLSKTLGLRDSTIKQQFKKFGFSLKTKEQRYSEIFTKVKNTLNKEYGVDYPLQSKEILEKMQDTVKERYNVDNVFQLEDIKQKSKNTCLEKHGCEHPLQNKEILNKQHDTNQSKYGHEFVGQVPEFKQKAIETNLNRYGTKSPMQSDIVKHKKEQTNLKRYGFLSPLESPKIIEKRTITVKNNKLKRLLPILHNFQYELLDKYTGIYDIENTKKQKRYNIKHTRCGTVFMDDLQLIPRCPECYPLIGTVTSIKENYYKYFIEDELKIAILPNYKDLIKNKETGKWFEVDIYAKEFKCAFEFNGLYTHSLGDHTREEGYRLNITKDYHKKKTEAALDVGVKLYHLWENVNPEIIKSKIRAVLGKITQHYYARKLKFKEISNSEANIFYDITHTQGSCVLFKSFGLFIENELIAAFSYRTLADKTSLEIARFSTQLNTNVVGGFSKLFKNSIKYIKKEYPAIKKIVTYADRDWSPDEKQTVYSKTGFTFIGNTGPSLFYTDFKKLYSRQQFQKYKLKELFPDSYNENLTEQQILSLNKIYPVYNSGNWKFEYYF